MSNMTLGSLFDGSGGFPLGGMLAGITPVWASEIEPFPIRVTTKRLPFMKHYGNVSEMYGGKVEPVDIITFGSPCQDMSVAGKRAGLEGSRSNLFYEAVRIIKEMRKATGGEYPKWACWENVPGAFSSSGGEDFRCVLESLCGVIDESVSIPKPKKWANAGEILGDGYSLAWRVLDAQFWGVPQRRKRIYLIADFTGGCAGKVLFESEGLSGYTPQGFRSWQTASGCSPDSSGAAGIGFDGYNAKLTDDKSATLGVNCGMSTGRNGVVLNDQGGNRMDVTEDVTCTLRAEAHHPPCVLEEAVAVENHPMDGRVKLEENGKVQTLSERMGTGGNNVPLVLKIRSGCEGGGKGPLIQTDKSATLSCNNDQTLFEPCSWDGGQISPTLTKQNAGGGQRMPDKDNFNCVLQPFGICSKDSNAMKSSNPHSGIYEADTSRTIDTSGGNPACNQGGIAVVAIEGNGSRPSHRGDGFKESDYGFIEKFIENLGERFNIREIAFDRWGAVQMVQNLEGMGFTVVPVGQGFKDMSPPTKELMKLTLEEKLAHGGQPVLRWMMDNIFIRTDPAGNIKPDKEKSTEKIDGAVATIMALDRAIRCGNDTSESVYDSSFCFLSFPRRTAVICKRQIVPAFGQQKKRVCFMLRIGE